VRLLNFGLACFRIELHDVAIYCCFGLNHEYAVLLSKWRVQDYLILKACMVLYVFYSFLRQSGTAGGKEVSRCFMWNSRFIHWRNKPYLPLLIAAEYHALVDII